MEESRSLMIDILRFIGLVLILLAHFAPNKSLLFQLRTCDVPIMVACSGMSFLYSSNNIKETKKYFAKRMLRLYLPVVVFLSLFFIIVKLNFTLQGTAFPFKGKVLGSFLLLGPTDPYTIGYLWIIRIFLLMALIAPLLYIIFLKVKKVHFLIILVGITLLYNLFLTFYTSAGLSVVHFLLSYYLFYLLGYSLPFVLGFFIIKSKRAHKGYLALVIFLILIIVHIIKNPNNLYSVSFQSSKYPPMLYFIVWGCFVSSLLSFVFDGLHLSDTPLKKIIVFVSRNSMWIYFYHIVLLYVYTWNNKLQFFHLNTWWKGFLFVLFAALFLTYLHKTLFLYVVNRMEPTSRIKKFLSLALL